MRREIMDMIHPMVRHECEEFYKAHRDEPAAYAEVPLLLEGGWHKKGYVDAVAGVSCPAEKRTGELREIRGLDAEMLATFDSWQWSEADKLAACDLVLANDGGLDDLQGRADELMAWVQERYDARNDKSSSWMAGVWTDLIEQVDKERMGE